MLKEKMLRNPRRSWISTFSPIAPGFEIRGFKVSPNLVHLNACLDACSKASAWKEALAMFANREVLSRKSWGYGLGVDDRLLQDIGGCNTSGH